MLKILRHMVAQMLRPATKTPPRFRPRLESLEDRLVPAVFNVTTLADIVDPSDGRLSLREAITLANATDAVDAIQLGRGVFEIQRSGTLENNNATGDFDILNPLVIKGAGSGLTVVDGANLDRVFDGRIGNLTLSNLSVRNGFAPGEVGGGIFVDASVRLVNCKVLDNAAAQGGGISAGGNVTLINSTVSDNTALSLDGGGIHAGNGRVTITRGSVSGNRAVDDGGGIVADNVILTDSIVADNVAGSNAGGIVTSNAVLTNSTLSGNRCDVTGGAVFAFKATITDCTISNNTAGSTGGGIYNANGGLTLIRSTVSGNTAIEDDGGGIFVTRTATLTNSRVSGNKATDDGGGIFSLDGVSLNNCIVAGNRTGDEGGGIFTDDLDINFSTIRRNEAGDLGGGIHATGDNCVIDATTISQNRASQGGGMFSAATLTMTRSALHGNRARVDGGAMVVLAGATLENVTLSGNSAVGVGGGCMVYGTLNLVNVTASRNVASNGGGVFVAGLGEASVRNTIIAGNRATGGISGQDVSGIFNSLGHNLIGIGDGGVGFSNGVKSDQVGTAVSPIDARLKPLGNNGGPTLTHALKADSPALDRGDNADISANTDQRGSGFARKKDGDGNGSAVIDIGAFER